MAVGLWVLDTVNGLGWYGDALGAAGPSNKPVGVVGGVLGDNHKSIFIFMFMFILFYKNDHALDPKGPTPGLI